MKLVDRTSWIPAMLWMVLIFLFSHQPGGGSGALSREVLEFLARLGLDLRIWFGKDAYWVIRKLAHFGIYAILFGWMVWPWSRRKNWPVSAWLALVCTVVYAASDEFHQLFIPGRVGDVQDVLIDSLGALAAFGTLTLGRYLSKKLPQLMRQLLL